MTDEEWKARLLTRLQEIEVSRRNTAEGRRPVELDQQSTGRLSRMDALQVQAMEQATERRRSQEILRIRSALRRLEEGEFGWCIGCGDRIPKRRLEIDPATPTCVRCASGG